MGTQDDSTETTYGGSVVYSKLERYPAMVRIWAGYAFSKDHNEERGHTYAQVDQENTQRVKLVEQASRQEMRTYVCAQCRVEYYFLGDDKVLTFPWSQGLTIDDIEAHYDQYEFKDWTHAETNAPMIKIQHPEYEMWSTSLHARSGVACADCHMPYVRKGAVKVSDHWLRSPLANVNQACQTCHQQDDAELEERVLTIQNRTAELLRLTEEALLDAMDAIVAAQAAGATDDQLEQARYLHRRASMRWDFVSSENSTGFHSPQESARVLAMALDFARQAQLEAERATPMAGK